MGFEMKSKQVGPMRYYKYAECTKGQVLTTGVYYKKEPDQFGNDAFFFVEDDGQHVKLNKSGGLVREMETCEIELGDYVRITYDGKYTLKKGPFKGREGHAFLIEVDSEKKRDLDKNPVPPPGAEDVFDEDGNVNI